MHLVRNAVDHGVESPDERKKKGKMRKERCRFALAETGITSR